ncbi:MAG: class II SORL domain-containing protein [Sedimentisphaeraceae bacterium JB056]
MAQKLSEQFKTADWKNEKHVPVIECSDTVEKGQLFNVKVTVGKEVAHPNTTAHHIRWIKLLVKEEGSKALVEIANMEFNAHGASADGADTSGIYTNHEAIISMKMEKSGTLYAMSYCNIHGLWESMREIKVD